MGAPLRDNQSRIVVILPRHLKNALKEESWRRRISMSDYVRIVLHAVLKAEETENEEKDAGSGFLEQQGTL